MIDGDDEPGVQLLRDGYATDLRFFLNGTEVVLERPDPTRLLVDFLRSPEMGLSGTKKSCGEGGCGACTVILSRPAGDAGPAKHVAINSCLRPLASLEGAWVTTVEGLGSARGRVDPVQHRIAAYNGSQCGYCTPGFVMTMRAHIEACRGKPGTKADIEALFDGNLCRCTGYRPILHAMKTFASDWEEADEKGTPACLVAPTQAVDRVSVVRRDLLPDGAGVQDRPLWLRHGEVEWIRPLTLKQLYELLDAYGGDRGKPRLVHGNTSFGVYRPEFENVRVFIDVSRISDLSRWEMCESELRLGGGMTYAEALVAIGEALHDAPPGWRAGLEALRYMVERTAGSLVRNTASLAGNSLMVAEHATRGEPFPSDLFTALASLEAQVVLGSARWSEPRRLPLLEWVAAYQEDRIMREEAVLLAYEIPMTGEGQFMRAFKVARREVDAHALVNAALSVRIGDDIIERASLVFGGIGPVAFHARGTESFLRGKAWTSGTLVAALDHLDRDLRAVTEDDVWSSRAAALRRDSYSGISPIYQREVAQSFFYQFFVHVSGRLAPDSVPTMDRSAGERRRRPVSSGTQTFQEYPREFPVSRPIIKLSALLQATGEAEYTSDLPLPKRGLEGAFVTSTRTLASFKYCLPDTPAVTVDIPTLLKALTARFPGVVDYVTAADIPPGGKNVQGIGDDDPLFGVDRVTCFGQCLGLVLAEDESTALSAAEFVRNRCVTYAPERPLSTITEARDAGSFFPPPPNDDLECIERPASEMDWLSGGPTVSVDGVECACVTGRQVTGSQIHFYMETQSCLAVPREARAITVHASTQSPDTIQQAVALTLGVGANDVSVEVKRVGGAYGGKTTRSPFVAAPTALAAWKHGRPVRVVLPRDTDTLMIGHRHSFVGEYAIAIAENGSDRGSIKGLRTSFFSNGGNTRDCSSIVMGFANLSADCAYNVPNYRSTGTVCKTNRSSNTAMRSFGMIQATIVVEDAIEAAAHSVGLHAEDVRALNLYRRGNRTPYGQSLDYCILPQVWERLMGSSRFAERRAAVEAFNRENRWRKRGISMIPLKYGVGYNLGWLEQGGAVIDVYAYDGTILLQHGGVEMGQGIMTKMAQIAAKTLDAPLELIRMAETNTQLIANPIPTGATSASGLNGGAVRAAALKLRRRLRRFCASLRKERGDEWCARAGIDYWRYPESWKARVSVGGHEAYIWQNVIALAYEYRVDLVAHALYRTPGLGDEADRQFYAFTYSAACSEVEIDVLTGESTILRSDILYDIGKSLNPAIDIGQIEGAFVMGAGYVLTEELVYQPEGERVGALNTLNTWSYKPPAPSSIPIELHVDLFPRSDARRVPKNPNLLMSSKGVGEPPLVLAASVFFAVKRAVLAARRDRGETAWFTLDAPATVQRIRDACLVNTSDMTL